MELKKFKELYSLDIANEIDKDYKGLKYLSWATAYKLAMEQDSKMTYEILEGEDGLPFFSRGSVHIVKTKVTMFGETKGMTLPIMDNKHNAVNNPNSRQVNDNIMRCLAKNIAMFGIGLPLYTGEDTIQFKQTPSRIPSQAVTKPKVSNDTKEKAFESVVMELIGDDFDFLEKQLSSLGAKALKDLTKDGIKTILLNLDLKYKVKTKDLIASKIKELG